MNGFHSSLNADEWVRIIALIMVLTLVLGNLAGRIGRMPRGAWVVLLWMALVWAGIIAVAALAFRNFRPDGF